MTSRHLVIGSIVLLACGSAIAAPPASFTKKPVATKVGDTVRIDFATDRECDVAVYIEDAGGKIVRHLAAGVLGKNAPEPFKANSLDQSIVWDGKDDDGRDTGVGGQGSGVGKGEKSPTPEPRAPIPAFKVRVGLGMHASYSGIAFADPTKAGPNRIDTVAGLATGPDGRLYVIDRWAGLAWWSTQKIHVLRRDGAYEQTIKPFSPNLAADKVKAVGAFVNSFGAINPLIYRAEGTAFYPQEEVAQQPAIIGDGAGSRIVLATRSNVSAYDSPRFHLAMLGIDGSVPEGGFDGPALKTAWAATPCLAATADGKGVYVAGVKQANSKQSANAIYYAKLPDRGPLEPFFGDPAVADKDNAHLSDPRGVAADGRGHVLVADFGNDRVVVLNEKDKSFAGSFAVEAPSWVAANPKTGAIYVASKKTQVIKFAGWQDAKEQARADLSKLLEKFSPAYRASTLMCYALDASADPAVLWAGCGSQLVRLDDLGEKFSEAVPANCVASEFFWRPAADPTRSQIACRVGVGSSRLHILDEATGQVRIVGDGSLAGQEGRTHRLGADGSIYAVDHGMGVFRYDRDGKPKPFEATAADGYLKGRLPAGQTGTTMWERDFCVDRKGDIYVRQNGTVYHGTMTVQVYDQQGRFKRTVLWTVSDGMFGPKVDARGNLYIMEIIKPLDQPYPDEFKGRIATKGPRGYEPMHWYDWIYGSVVKFGPEGGAVWFNSGRLATSSALSYEGWRAWSPVVDDIVFVSGDANSVTDLKTTGGSLTGTILKKPVTLAFPWPCTIDTAAQNKITLRLKNDSDGTHAKLGYHLVGERYATPPSTTTIDIKPNSDFTEYTFDLAGEKNWKGHVFALTLSPTDGAKGSFAIDWVRVGDPGQPGAMAWDFNAEDSPATKLPATMKKEKVAAFSCPQGADLQGALWYRPGFGHVGQCSNNDHCHCAGTDFDVDDFGRVFAPDTGRFRIGVLDTNGNEIMSFGAYGNQNYCGPDSYVVDPATKLLRPRKADDPKALVSPFAAEGSPAIAFGWICGVATTDRYAYVSDLINKRVLRVKLAYAVEESCALPPTPSGRGPG